MITKTIKHQSSSTYAAPSSGNEYYSAEEDPDPLPSGSALQKSSEEEEPPGHSHIELQPLVSAQILQTVRKSRNSFPITSSNSSLFRDRFYPDISDREWNNWHWQFSNRIRTLESLERLFILSDAEKSAMTLSEGKLPVAVTPYYASLIDQHDSEQPLRRTVIPVSQEFILNKGESEDPLNEESCCKAPGLFHRYPDRVLFLATNVCSVNCRYCTRSRVVGNGEANFSRSDWDKSLKYINAHPEVRDVLISGGDPLTLPENSLEYLLIRLRAIPHVEIIRIGTKIPMVLPQRITNSLVNMLRKHHPLWISIHCTHPDEITPEASEACRRLADAGIPLGSQTVLLKGVNDQVDTLTRLFQKLMQIRVKPYYLYQCDPIAGSEHFRTTVRKGIELIRGIRGFTSGYAVPHYVIDAPGGGGKIPICPDYIQGTSGGAVFLKNYENKTYVYPDDSLEGGNY